MALFRVQSHDFSRIVLAIEMSSFFKGPKVLINGEEVKLTKKKAVIKDDSYRDRTIALASSFFELPSLKIDSETFYPAGKLSIFEKVLVLLPMGLVVVGGAIGGGLGALSAYMNIFLMVKYRDSSLKYLLAVSTSGIAFILWLFIYTLIHMMRNS